MAFLSTPGRRHLATVCVVVGGLLWIAIASAVLFSTLVFHRTVLASSGTSGFEGYPAQAETDLIYATYYYCLFLAGGGALTVAVGLFPLRRLEPWAWGATVVVAIIGGTETLLDGILWSGWWVFPVYALFPLLGAILAAPDHLTRPAGTGRSDPVRPGREGGDLMPGP